MSADGVGVLDLEGGPLRSFRKFDIVKNFTTTTTTTTPTNGKNKGDGQSGNRTLDLSHAKRKLYH